MIENLLNREPSCELIVEIAEVALAYRFERIDFPRYFSSMASAIQDEPPPFATTEYGEVYRSLSFEDRWMAVSLVTNAEREGDGSKRLWSLAACASNSEHQQLLKRHACDESRHARVYLNLLDLSFPNAVDSEFRADLKQLSPGFSMSQELFPVEGSPYAKEPTIDDFLQMNIAEIRTTVHHIMQRSALALIAPSDNLRKIGKLLDSLLKDELDHVAYTAKLIDDGTENAEPSKLASLFRRRFQNFNTITTEELGDNVFDCSVACCAKRPWCRSKATDSIQLQQIGPFL